MKLGLFFTLGVSLELWHNLGLLDREKLIYERLLDQEVVDRIYWFTYGVNDKRFENLLPRGILVVPMPAFFAGRIGSLLYSFLAPLFLRRFLRDTDVIKTNQMRGSWAGVAASILYRKPLIVRTGFTWSLFARRTTTLLSLDRLAVFFERAAYGAADIAVVASRRDEAYVTATYRLPPEKLRVIGNYVDVSVFKPDPSAVRHDDRMVFVGRLAPQKNLGNLIRALGGLPYGLDIYGHDDSLKGGLQALAEQVGARVTFHPAVPNRKLGAVLNSYSLFVLPSLYEGMPKVLLEAMACGLAVLGTNVEGINEVIRHQTSGFLVQGTDPASLREGILALAPNRSLQKTLGAEAARHVRENYSLEAIFEKEAAVIKALS